MVRQDKLAVRLADLVGRRAPPPLLELEQTVRVGAREAELLLDLLGPVLRLLVRVYDGAVVHTYKKSQYWSKEVEEKLGLAGADPYGLLELEERRWRATPDEIRKAYRKLVLTHHPDKKAQSEESPAPKKEKAKKGGEKKAEDCLLYTSDAADD